MSADNTLARLELVDGYRLADIHTLWDGDEHRLLEPYNKRAFSTSPHYPTLEEAEAAEEQLWDRYDREGRVVEYGGSAYKLEMTWQEYLEAGDLPLKECPVCSVPVSMLHRICVGTEDVACSGCIDGSRF